MIDFVVRIARQIQRRTGQRPGWLLLGVLMAGSAVFAAWLLNRVFERSWEVIALFLLAMLVVTLLRRMIAGAIPEPQPPRHIDEAAAPEPQGLEEIETELTGIDRSYGWMAAAPALTFLLIIIRLAI